MIPKFLDPLLENRIHSDDLVMECMGRLVQSQVEFRTQTRCKQHTEWQLPTLLQPQKIKSLNPLWNLSLLEALKVEDDSSLKGHYISRHPHYQEVWKLLQCIFSASKLQNYSFKIPWRWRKRWPAFTQQLWRWPSRSVHLRYQFWTEMLLGLSLQFVSVHTTRNSHFFCTVYLQKMDTIMPS